MKHLLTGVAMATAFAIAAPVWAQNAPMTPSSPPAAAPAAPAAPAAKAPAAAPAKPAAAKPMAAKPMAMKPMKMKKPMRRRMARMRGGDTTENLNRAELQRIMGGGAPMAPGAAGGNNPTTGAAGPFAPK